MSSGNPELIIQWAKGCIQKAEQDGMRVTKFIFSNEAEKPLLKKLCTTGAVKKEIDIVGKTMMLCGVRLVVDRRLPGTRVLVLLEH